MTASKIIFKRSSILGKRPSNHLQPGEIGLNTNSTEPGLFFNTTDGRTVKVGPTAVLPLAPLDNPERGESWLDVGKGTLNIGDAKNLWRSVAAPYLGGGGTVVFVAPEFSYASDSALNDGQTLPFQTLTRAVIEVTKLKIANILAGLVPSENNKFVIIAAPSALTINNEPGTTLDDFDVVFDEASNSNILTRDLVKFNAPEGGVIIPGDITFRGVDLRKCILTPTYVPSYKHPGLPEVYAGVNQPLSNFIKGAGNSFCENFSMRDKISVRTVSDIESDGLIAVFKSSSPHGLGRNDKVEVSISPNVDSSSGTFKNGTYFVNPVDSFRFQLVTGDLDDPQSGGVYVQLSSLPRFGNTVGVKFTVTNKLKSAHRLTGFRYASFNNLAEFYTKVQRAFPVFFGGRVVEGAKLVQENENVLVAKASSPYPENFEANTTRNASCYIRKVILKSDYGMNLIDIDGDDVEGFRSLITNECTSVSIQKDPAAYEIYTIITDPSTGKFSQDWWTLLEATYYSLPNSERPKDIREVKEEDQLLTLNQTSIENIRYHYKTLTDSEGNSFGLADISDDFRHYGIRARDSAYIQAQSVYTIGCAIGVWSLNGAFIHLTNSTSNFGSVAFKSEGFRGITTLGGAYLNAKGFQFDGIQRPLSLSLSQVLDPANKKIFSLGSRIISSEVDPNNPSIQILTLSSNFLPCYILPYSLKPGTAIWVSSQDCTYRGFLASDGGPTVILGSGEQCDLNAKLRIRYSDSTIPTDNQAISNLDIPYIRRFADPRKPEDRAYQFVISNTSTEAIAPVVGSVLRLNQTGQNLGVTTLRPNVQFDPGPLGGWGRLFTVDYARTAKLANSPNYNYVVGDSTQDNKYLVTLTVSDVASPWLSGKNDNMAQGSYCTFANKTWYTAENSIWSSVYYDVNFSSTVGPHKIAPVENCSPFVPSNSLERLEPVSKTYQGIFGSDPILESLTGEDRERYLSGSYFRGSTVPYTEYSIQSYYDGDDGSDDLGLILKTQKSGKSTVLVSPVNASAVVPKPTLPSVYGSLRESPTIVEFYVLSSANIVNPKQSISILKLEQGDKEEYLQVIGLVGTKVTAMRLNNSNSYYPDPVGSVSEDIIWNVSTVNPVLVHICEAGETPDPKLYDPDWANTKFCVLRFFEIMGYSRATMAPFLTPRYWGERFFSIGSLNKTPDSDGYALTTAQWPLEFNQPSTIVANTHTWAYCGYPFYSQGLPRYQTNEISKKLSYDFLSTATWSGRVTISGINDRGEKIFFGPQREAITAQFHKLENPEVNLATQQIFIDQPIVEFPGQVVAYTVDSISEKFDGNSTAFLLTKGGLEVPTSHVNANSLWVQLGGVVQKPAANYTTNGSSILFSEPPPKGTYCDIRIVTSEDSEKTLKTVVLDVSEETPSSDSILTLTSETDISKLNINSENTIVIVGGVNQLPMDSYTVSRLNPSEIQITFSGVLPEGVTLDIRSICSGSYWASKGIFPVAVYPLDDISSEFYTVGQTSFELTYNGKPVDPSSINTENLLVSVGGTMQLPLYDTGGVTKGSYKVATNSSGKAVIVFQEPPPAGATADLRVITNSEFLPCSAGRGRTGGFFKWGPSLVLNLSQDVENLKDVVEDKG